MTDPRPPTSLPDDLPAWTKARTYRRKDRYLSGERILPPPLTGSEPCAQVIEGTFLAYNAARLREGARLMSGRMLEPDVTVGMSLAGALTPAGLGPACLVPLINAGFVDWIVATGANLYHDLHFAFDLPLHAGTHEADDADLLDNDVVRIYDVFLSHRDTLIATDAILDQIFQQPEMQHEMGTAEFHYRLGRYADVWQRYAGVGEVSVLAAAWRAGLPVYTSSPGDSALGMSVAALTLKGNRLKLDPLIDVNETAAIVLAAKREGGKSGVFLVGGGSPKNFVLQTEPHIQESYLIDEAGHDYFFQITDARPDTGGLSGATPSEAVSWGKVDPDQLPNAVVCYTDATVALPLVTQYLLATHQPRPHRHLYERRAAMLEVVRREYVARHPPGLEAAPGFSAGALPPGADPDGPPTGDEPAGRDET